MEDERFLCFVAISNTWPLEGRKRLASLLSELMYMEFQAGYALGLKSYDFMAGQPQVREKGAKLEKMFNQLMNLPV